MRRCIPKNCLQGKMGRPMKRTKQLRAISRQREAAKRLERELNHLCAGIPEEIAAIEAVQEADDSDYDPLESTAVVSEDQQFCPCSNDDETCDECRGTLDDCSCAAGQGICAYCTEVDERLANKVKALCASFPNSAFAAIYLGQLVCLSVMPLPLASLPQCSLRRNCSGTRLPLYEKGRESGAKL